MHGQGLVRFIIGIVGNVTSGLLFLSPAPTFWRIAKKKSTEEFHPYPYLATVMNCLFWIFYGLPMVHPDSTLVITINSAGLALAIIYLSIFFFHTNKKYRVRIFLFLLGEAALLGAVAAITLLCFHTIKVRSMFVGIICDIFGILMYGSPLTILKQVVRTKSVEFLPFWLCLANFCNGIVWFTYAFLKHIDPYIAFGNGFGALLGFIQLSVYAYYTLQAKNNTSVQNDVEAGEVQLQKTKKTNAQV